MPNPQTEHQVYPNVNMPLVTKEGNITPPWQRFLLSLWQRTGGAQSNTNATGFITAWAGAAIPNGYLLCDGAEISRNSYAALFAAIGITWGDGDGKDTFNLPDLMDRFPRGATTPGATGGADETTLASGQVPTHTHTVNDPGHTHAIVDPGHVHVSVIESDIVVTGTDPGGVEDGDTESAVTGITAASAFTGITIEPNSGGSDPVPTLPSYATVCWVIKT